MWEITQLNTDRPVPLPPTSSRLGATKITWFESEPGVAVILTEGGTVDDRALAEAVMRETLACVGIRQARFSFDAHIWEDANERNRAVKDQNCKNNRATEASFRRVGDWNDIMAKAKRLVQSGNVTLLRNGYNIIVAHVIGDHGEYVSEISRDDPQSRAITQWTCECPWDQYAFQRTRKWKKYEARPCAHVLAAYWKSLASPLDEEVGPDGQAPPVGPMGPPPAVTPGGGVTAPDGFQPPGGVPPVPGGIPPGPMPSAPPMSPAPMPSQLPPMMAPPGGNQVIPPFPMDQAGQQMPVSVPGGRPGPYPANPLQQPGTLSKVAVMTLPQEKRHWQHTAPPTGSWEMMHQLPNGYHVRKLNTDEAYHVRCFIEPDKLTPMDRRSPFQNPRRSSEEPEVIHYPDNPDIEPSMGSGVPFIHQRRENKLHLGQEGWYHRHIYGEMQDAGHMPHGVEGVVYMPEGDVQWCYGAQPHEGAMNALTRHYGQPMNVYEPLWAQEGTNWDA